MANQQIEKVCCFYMANQQIHDRQAVKKNKNQQNTLKTSCKKQPQQMQCKWVVKTQQTHDRQAVKT